MASGSPYNQYPPPAGYQQAQMPQPPPYIPPQQAPGPGQHYQTPAHGYGAPPAPSGQQPPGTTPSFGAPGPQSTQAALQSTAKSFYKVGKGLLGDLASNIKTKYPGSAPGAGSAPPVPPASTRPPQQPQAGAPTPLSPQQSWNNPSQSIPHASTFPQQPLHQPGPPHTTAPTPLSHQQSWHNPNQSMSAPPDPQIYSPPTSRPSFTYYHPTAPAQQPAYQPPLPTSPAQGITTALHSLPPAPSYQHHHEHRLSLVAGQDVNLQSPAQPHPPNTGLGQANPGYDPTHGGHPPQAHQPSYNTPPTQYSGPSVQSPAPLSYQPPPPAPQQQQHGGYAGPPGSVHSLGSLPSPPAVPQSGYAGHVQQPLYSGQHEQPVPQNYQETGITPPHPVAPASLPTPNPTVYSGQSSAAPQHPHGPFDPLTSPQGHQSSPTTVPQQVAPPPVLSPQPTVPGQSGPILEQPQGFYDPYAPQATAQPQQSTTAPQQVGASPAASVQPATYGQATAGQEPSHPSYVPRPNPGQEQQPPTTSPQQAYPTHAPVQPLATQSPATAPQYHHQPHESMGQPQGTPSVHNAAPTANEHYHYPPPPPPVGDKPSSTLTDHPSVPAPTASAGPNFQTYSSSATEPATHTQSNTPGQQPTSAAGQHYYHATPVDPSSSASITNVSATAPAPTTTAGNSHHTYNPSVHDPASQIQSHTPDQYPPPAPAQHYHYPPVPEPLGASSTAGSSAPVSTIPPETSHQAYNPSVHNPGPQTQSSAPGQQVPSASTQQYHYPSAADPVNAYSVAGTPAPGPTTTAANPYQAYSPPGHDTALQAQSSQPAHQTPPTATQHYYYPPPPPHAPQGGHPGAPGAPGTASTAAMAMGFQSYNPQVPPQPTYASPSAAQPEGTYNSYANYQPALPQDPLAALSSQMSGLNVQGGYRDAAAPSGPAPVADDSPRGPPPCQATGNPWDTLAFCPENRIVEYSLDWYRLPDIPEYLICTRCHADHIARTHLAGSFERVTQPDGSASVCGFWSPRAKEVLWPQAVRNNDLSALRTYMKKDTTLPACKGRAVITGADGIKWYGMAQNEVDGFIACETCYEDRIVGTSFESRFSPYQQQGPDDKWTCDLGMPYISAAMAKMGKTNDWQGFVDGAKKRLSLRACEGEVVEYNGTNWYRPRRTIENMCICETCYLDKLALSRFANEFELEEQGTGFDAFMARIGKRVTCDLSDKAVSMTSALDAAIHQRNFDVWWNAANSIINLVPCTENGIIRGKWWTVAGGCPELDICEACYSGILKPWGVSHFFEQAERDSTATIVCNFHPKSPRFVSFVNKFNEAVDKGVFSIYSDYVKKWAGVPACPGIGHLEKVKWWGYPEALFCKSCYLGFVVDTPLANHIPVKEVYDERALVCQIWSPRMRKMWLEVCAAGPPGSPESEAALAEFKAFGTRRMEVYLATVPQIKMIQQMKMMKMQNAMHQGQLSLMYQGMNSMAAISGTTDGYLHGNSSLGYYETEHGATAAQMMNNMHSGMADANSGGDWMQIERLSAMWMEVE